MITISQEVLALHRLASLLIFTMLFIVSLFRLRGPMRAVVSLLLLVLIYVHYFIVLYISRYVSLSIYPLVIVESTPKGSTLYVDVGQVSALCEVLIWRKSVRRIAESATRRIYCSFKRLREGRNANN